MKTTLATILIIDDEQRIANIYLRFLVESGFIVRLATGAGEALNILLREDIDLVLLDINMPGINGKTIFDILKEYDPRIKIIVVSAYPVHVQRQIIICALDYHDKSDNHSNLLNKVLRVTNHDETKEGL